MDKSVCPIGQKISLKQLFWILLKLRIKLIGMVTIYEGVVVVVVLPILNRV